MASGWRGNSTDEPGTAKRADLARLEVRNMTLNEVKTAVRAGRTVYVRTEAYLVVRDNLGQWLIVCAQNGYTTGLTWRDGIRMNCAEEDFILAPLVLAPVPGVEAI